MHASVMDWLRQEIAGLDLTTAKVLEVGSLNVNGSARDLIEPLMENPQNYTGIDIRLGPGVDIPARADEAPNIGTDFDLVVSTEMLEHAEDWKGAVNGMKLALKPGGHLLLTARGPGFKRHNEPGDFWRFMVLDMQRIFGDLEGLRVTSDPQYAGVFVSGRKPNHRWKRQVLERIEVARI